jgi:hypothetical protein
MQRDDKTYLKLFSVFGSCQYYLKLIDISIGTFGSSPIYFARIVDPDFAGIIFVTVPRESRSLFFIKDLKGKGS